MSNPGVHSAEPAPVCKSSPCPSTRTARWPCALKFDLHTGHIGDFRCKPLLCCTLQPAHAATECQARFWSLDTIAIGPCCDSPTHAPAGRRVDAGHLVAVRASQETAQHSDDTANQPVQFQCASAGMRLAWTVVPKQPCSAASMPRRQHSSDPDTLAVRQTRHSMQRGASA